MVTSLLPKLAARERSEPPAHPGVWRGRHASVAWPCVASGHAPLDALLPGGGWPLGALTEILAAAPGYGEWSLLTPALIRLAEPQRRIALIAPPCLPYAPGLGALGLPTDTLLVVAGRDQRDTLWAAEQCLRSGSCGAVLAWIAGSDERALRRLQLAAESSRSLGVVIRYDAAERNTPAAVRVRLSSAALAWRVDLLKCRGGSAGTRCAIPWPERVENRPCSG